MGVKDTFSLIAGLPAENRLPYVEAALREPYAELQSAAFDALTDPEGLHRPDLIVRHYADLTPEVRAKVDEIVAQTSEEELQSLRKSIDEIPETASALKEKGLNSSHVIAINIADGVLTMIAKTA